MNNIITVNFNQVDRSIKTKDLLVEKLIRLGFQVSFDFSPDTDLIISIGGDGSFLKTVHDYDFPDIPIIGINTGHLGFFPEISPDKIDAFIEAYKHNDCFIEERNILECTISNHQYSSKIYALNEIVVKSDKSRTIHLDLNVNNNHIEKFSGDGMILSSSTGSTAYNYSAGGSIVDPSLNLIQLTPLYPINTNAYRSFTSSIIFSSESNIVISPENYIEDSLLIIIDGIEHKFSKVSTVETKISNTKIKLLRMSNYEFWNRVSTKFL